MIIGIDLGTTNSLAACLTEHGPTLIPNAHGDFLTPSAVGIDHGGQIIVGSAAKELQVTHPERCTTVFKRLMGTDVSMPLAQRQFRPEELSSLILRSLRIDAEAFLKQPVDEAVVTVPAYFNDQQRKATIRAGELAGLKVRRIINEPTAAAIAYGLHQADVERIALVYDLGGGTFDVSVVDQFEGVLEIKSSAGEIFLGGEDFTRALVGRVLQQRNLPFEQTELRYPCLVSRLMRECEIAKKKLSQAEFAEIRMPERDGTVKEDCDVHTVTAVEFREWTNHLVERTRLPLHRALSDAGLEPRQVHEVILVGGATRMPQVAQMLHAIFGKEARSTLNPDHVVALGVAIQAGLVQRNAGVSEIIVTDISPFSLGIEISNEIAGEYRSGYFFPVINRNTTIPVSRVRTVNTTHADQQMVSVRIYQGEARKVVDNLFLGEFQVTGIPRGPKGQAIDIRFTYDPNGILEVDAIVNETGKKFTHVIKPGAGSLNEAEIKAALEKMQALKFHPRDDEHNRFAMLAADRLYREIPPRLRDQFQSLIQNFESAIEGQDAEMIEIARLTLTAFISDFDSENGRSL